MLEQIPTTENIQFKQAFVERYSQLTDWEAFKKYSLSFLRRSIRINTLQGTVKEVKKSIEDKGWKLDPIPWCKGGFWIEGPTVELLKSHSTNPRPPTPRSVQGETTLIEGENVKRRRDVGNLLEHHIGKIYVQEAASMIPPLVLQPKPGDLVLDLCAAPGSKTTQMAAMMRNKGLIVANDYKGSRLQSLGINLQRSGLTNVLVTLMHGKRFHKFEFDKILVDAPCSGTGTIRKSLKTITIWNAGMITKLARQQKALLENAFNNLKDDGELVYSTCSVEPEENEGVVSWLLEKYANAKVVPVKLPGLQTSKPIMEFGKEKYNPQVKHTLRIWPQDNDTEGFFVAKIIKK